MVDQPEKTRFPDGFRVLQGKQEFVTYMEHSSVRVWPSNREGHFEMHMHSAVEVIVPTQGASVYRMADREYKVEPGQILFIPSNVPHELTEEEGIFRHLILFEPSVLHSLQDIQQNFQFTQHPIYMREPTETREQVSKLLHELVETYFEHRPMWNTRCYACLLQVYALLAVEYRPAQEPQPDAVHRSIDPEIMNMAINYIGDHYTEEVTLEQVAAFAGYSKYYFSRTFRDYFGISFSDYVLVKRINQAANLLVHTDRAIGDVAKDSGFGSIATFNRIFRKHKNCTPTRYRAIYSDRLMKDKGW